MSKYDNEEKKFQNKQVTQKKIKLSSRFRSKTKKYSRNAKKSQTDLKNFK